jgi:hypothetical protein
MNKLPFLRFLESWTGPETASKREAVTRQKPNQESQNSKTRSTLLHLFQMKMISYLFRIFVCLPILSFQTKSKTKPDPGIPGSSRDREQPLLSSSVFPVRSPGDQLHVVALRPTDPRGIGMTPHKR